VNPRPDSEGVRVFIVAGEESGDRLGAPLMRALRTRTDGKVAFLGVGGRDMAGEGLSSPFPIADLAIFGFSAIPRRLPLILRRIRETADAVEAARPDVLVIIDSPDFTHRVARRVRRRLPRLPIVDYVSPSVWAWRPGRAKTMRRYVDHVLALLPFEPDAHARLGGPACTYVGHPLTEQVALLRPDAVEAQFRSADPPRVLVLPGSRGGEIARHLDLFGDALARVREACGELDLVLPTLPHLAERVLSRTRGWASPPRIVVDAGEKWAAFRTARAALAASGTVTLELAIAGVPTVVAYRVSVIEKLIADLFVKVPTIVLANLVLGANVMPEILQRDATPMRLADAFIALVGDTPQRQQQIAAFAAIDAAMDVGGVPPSVHAAEVVLAAICRLGVS
jgi:lipid-A-disaccharide synthase